LLGLAVFPKELFACQ